MVQSSHNLDMYDSRFIYCPTVSLVKAIPAGILYKSIAGRYRPVSVADGPITARYRFIKNAYWDGMLTHLASHKRGIGKYCRPRSDAAKGCVGSRPTLFALYNVCKDKPC